MSTQTNQIRRATESDLPAIVRMLADDPLGKTREKDETPLPEAYVRAFRAIDADPNNELVVASDEEGSAVAVMQLTFTPFITHQGGWRAGIEGVRVRESHRALGLGRSLLEWGIERARARGCHVVQLTSDKRRPDAIRFYETLGFKATHEGMKLVLPGASPPAGAEPAR